MTTLQKYFQNKTYIDVLEVMIESVELDIPDFTVNMDSFGGTKGVNIKTGETKTTKKDFVIRPVLWGLYNKKEQFEKVTINETFKTEIICFGCVATKTLFNIFHQENPTWKILDSIEKSKKSGYTFDKEFYVFELLFDAFRKLDVCVFNYFILEELSEFTHLLYPEDLNVPYYISPLTTENYKEEIKNWKLWLKELKNNK